MAYIGAWGVPWSEKVENGLKLLFRGGSERLCTIERALGYYLHNR
jgi:hypothetical protein